MRIVFFHILLFIPWLSIAATEGVTPTVDIFLINQDGSSNPLMIRNEIKSNFKKGKFWIPVGSTLEFKVHGSPQKKEKSAYRWHLTDGPSMGSNKTEGIEKTGEPVRFTFSKPKEASVALKLAQSEQQLVWNFFAAAPPWIQIVEPKKEIIIAYGEKVHFLANSSDAEGKLPNIFWLVRHKNVQHIIGSGDEIDFRWFDVGHNEIRAYAIDDYGQKTISKPITIIISHQTIPTRIISPKDQSEFKWNQYILFKAVGNNLEYSLDGAPFQSNSSFVRGGLSPGKHTIVFRGDKGTVTHTFTIIKPKLTVASVNRVNGTVLLSEEKGIWKPLQKESSIPANALLKSGEDGFAEIMLNNGVIYQLRNNNTVQILEDGRIVKNISHEELAIYSITHPKHVGQVVEQLKPLIAQLKELLREYKVESIEMENEQNTSNLIDQILKGNVKIEKVIIE